jgi:hypothetical protein
MFEAKEVMPYELCIILLWVSVPAPKIIQQYPIMLSQKSRRYNTQKMALCSATFLVKKTSNLTHGNLKDIVLYKLSSYCFLNVYAAINTHLFI